MNKITVEISKEKGKEIKIKCTPNDNFIFKAKKMGNEIIIYIKDKDEK